MGISINLHPRKAAVCIPTKYDKFEDYIEGKSIMEIAKRHLRNFTLIEVLIALVIISIIAAVTFGAIHNIGSSHEKTLKAPSGQHQTTFPGGSPANTKAAGGYYVATIKLHFSHYGSSIESELVAWAVKHPNRKIVSVVPAEDGIVIISKD